MIWDYLESENNEFGTNDDSNNAGCQNISVIKNWHKNQQIAAVVILNYSISKHKKKYKSFEKTTNSVKLVQLTTQQLKAASALSMTRKIAMKQKWWCSYIHALLLSIIL